MTEIDDARRRSFDDVADEYDEVRPGYPSAVFDELVSRIPPPARVLEVGAGTGQASGPLLERGYEVLAIEPGQRLAARLRRRFAASALVVREERFEDWDPGAGRYDLATAFSSFHWVEPDIGFERLATALRPAGWLGLAWNEPSPTVRPGSFEDVVQPIYARLAPALTIARQGAQPDWKPRIEASGAFGPVERMSFPWSRRLSTDAYLRLLNTYSNHRVLDADDRSELHRQIAELIDTRFGGEVVEERVTVLYLAVRP